MWIYLLVLASTMAIDLIPILGPPAWTVMVLFQVKYDLNLWGVVVFGVAGSALGRYLLSLYIPHFSKKIIRKEKTRDLKFVGKKLEQNWWHTSVFVATYALLPLPTDALFTAAGIAKINTLRIVPAFFVGEFISDLIMVVTGRTAVDSFAEMLHGAFSAKSIALSLLAAVVFGAVFFVDWRALLERKKLVLHFKFWK